MTDMVVGHHPDSNRFDVDEWLGEPGPPAHELRAYQSPQDFFDKAGSTMNLFAISNEFLLDPYVHVAAHGSLAGGYGLPSDLAAQQLRARFDELAAQWRRETSTISVMSAIVMHPAYQMIIGMGPQVVPWIIEELRARSGFWFWALTAITQEDPARDIRRSSEARGAWLDWAGARGL